MFCFVLGPKVAFVKMLHDLMVQVTLMKSTYVKRKQPTHTKKNSTALLVQHTFICHTHPRNAESIQKYTQVCRTCDIVLEGTGTRL